MDKLYMAKADLLILTGAIAPHYSLIYNGGRKASSRGCSLEMPKTPPLPTLPYGLAYGRTEVNPFHQETLYGAGMAGVYFIYNVVKNASGNVVAAVAGSLWQAH